MTKTGNLGYEEEPSIESGRLQSLYLFFHCGKCFTKKKKKVAVIQANKWMHVFNCLPVMMGVCLQNELSWVGTTGGKALARF